MFQEYDVIVVGAGHAGCEAAAAAAKSPCIVSCRVQGSCMLDSCDYSTHERDSSIVHLTP